MKKNLLISIVCFATLAYQNIYAQSVNSSGAKRCGTTEYIELLKQQDPGLEARMAKIEADIQAWLKNSPPVTNAVITIPVVVHVVYNGANQNIPDTYINQQLDRLNKDYRKQNTDWNKTPAVFQPLVADCEIQFCLATKNPQGANTTGIIRKSTTVSAFNPNNDAVKFDNMGGSTTWNNTKYLNIWICNLSGGILGYTAPPGALPPERDGVALHYTSLPGPPIDPEYDLGRSATHEIGHWLNLDHPWANGNCASDNVADTPPQQGPNFGCTSFPHVSCSNGPNGDLFMNYMDYQDDACMFMFTAGQKARMIAALNGPRSGLLTSAATNCASNIAIDAGAASIITPNGIVCNTTFTPIIKLQNFGTNPLTSCTINYKIDALSNQTFNWTGSLASGQSVNVTLPSMTTTGGTHTFTSSTSSPNGSTDGNTSNDQTTSTFNASASAQQIPFAEGLENTTFPPSGWALNNPDAGSITWTRTTTAAKTGTASMFMDNYNYDKGNKHIDELTTPPLNIASVQNPSATFQVAYQMYSDPTTYFGSDTLKVYISTDCGVTWTSLYNKYHTQLITATPQFDTLRAFVPTASQWRLETISLTAYASATNALIKFQHICDYENNLYVDDINVTGLPGVNELNLDNIISIFPNPSDENIFVNFSIFDLGKVNIKVCNLVGEVIANVTDNISVPKKIKINLADQSNGIYFVEIRTENKSITKKLILNK
ncbi:MAG: M43 family zinc metalloprotease [Bacteroidota bacterium]